MGSICSSIKLHTTLFSKADQIYQHYTRQKLKMKMVLVKLIVVSLAVASAQAWWFKSPSPVCQIALGVTGGTPLKHSSKKLYSIFKSYYIGLNECRLRYPVEDQDCDDDLYGRFNPKNTTGCYDNGYKS